MFCTQCGSEMPEGVSHCLICGAPARIVLPRPGAAPVPPTPADPFAQDAPAPEGPAPEPFAPPAPADPPAPGRPIRGLEGEGLSDPPEPPAASSEPPAPGYAPPPAPGPAYQAPPPAPAYARGPACQPPAAGPAYQAPAPGGPYTGQPGPYVPPPPAYPPQPPVSGPAYPAYHQYAGGIDSPETVSLGEWLVSYLLMLVPIANLVLPFVWAFGAGQKPSKRNWARAMLIVMGVSLLLCLLVGAALYGWMMSEVLPYL